MTNIKICGLQPGDDLSFTNHSAVSHVGIVFVPASKRYVHPKDAIQITSQINANCKAVGVFVNAELDELLATAKQAGLAVVQLHGQESPAFCARVKEQGIGVWKALSVPNEPDQWSNFLETLQSYAGNVDALLLDAAPPKGAGTVSGGHGAQFDWDMLQHLDIISKAVPLWIAGGLRPDNVSGLLHSYQPFGVDVSSGVEVDGRKSNARVVEFIEAVTAHDTKQNHIS